MWPDDEKAAENTAVLSRTLKKYGRISASQNRVCPCQLMVCKFRTSMQTTETHHALVLDPDGLAVPHLDDLVLKGIAAVADAVDDGQRLLPLGLREPRSDIFAVSRRGKI